MNARSKTNGKAKFADQGELLSDLYDHRIVVCPKCSKPTDFFDLKITCVHCGYNKVFEPMHPGSKLTLMIDEIEDYLQAPCCGKTLWAINLDHLNFLQDYVEAALRERIPNQNKSLASRLPQWIKSRKNRDEILKGIKRLRKKLKENNYMPKH